MSDMKYDSGGLRDGASKNRQSGEAAAGAARTLSGVSVDAHPFGDVNNAGSFAGAVGEAHQHHIAGATNASTQRDIEGGRADKTATLGDELTSATTTVADQAAVRRVADGMS